MKASLAKRNDYQVKCDKLNLAQLSGRLQWRRRRTRAVSPSEKCAKKRSRIVSYKSSRILKAKLMLLTENLQRNPTNEKGKGRPLPARETTLTNLTTVKLSRKRCPKISGRTCVESMLCKVHPELYIPPLTQPIMNAPNLYHFKRLGVLCWFEVEQSRMVVCWADLIWLSGVAVVVCSDGLPFVVWSDDGLVW